MYITDKLFELIVLKTKTEQESQINLDRIKLLIKNSEEYKKLGGLGDLEISYKKTKKFPKVMSDKDSIEELYTLLTAATENNKLEVVKLLVSVGGMDVNDQTACPSPLWFAARTNAINIAQFLIDNKANINSVYQRPHATPLQIASTNGAYEVARLLLLNNADLELPNTDGKTALSFARGAVTNLIKAAREFKNAIKQLEVENDVFSATSSLTLAFKYDASFILSYLSKMALITNLRSQGIEHDEAYYHPHLLRISIKVLKSLIKTVPEFVGSSFPEGFKELVEPLNAYDSSSTFFEESEKIFHTSNEKTKTLKWFEKGTDFESAKLKMKESELLGKPVSSDKGNEPNEVKSANVTQSSLTQSPGVRSPIFGLEQRKIDTSVSDLPQGNPNNNNQF